MTPTKETLIKVSVDALSDLYSFIVNLYLTPVLDIYRRREITEAGGQGTRGEARYDDGKWKKKRVCVLVYEEGPLPEPGARILYR